MISYMGALAVGAMCFWAFTLGIRIGHQRGMRDKALACIAAKTEGFEAGRQSVQTFDYEALERHSAPLTGCDTSQLTRQVDELQRAILLNCRGNDERT